ILTYLDGVVKVEETDLKPRVGFLYPLPTHNISVVINATRERDSGQYMCTVNVADEDSSVGKNVGIINLTVLVPPAPPTCELHGDPVVGANVTLSCSSSKGKPVPWYQWQRTDPTFQVFSSPAHGTVAPEAGGIKGGFGSGVALPPLQFSPADRVKGTLKLTNLSSDMAGLYVCAAENRAGSAKCNVVLEV
ncbi:ESAM protein, partial [Trogon melanurus]|nr:ESAM protein [Trogon melanurus]